MASVVLSFSIQFSKFWILRAGIRLIFEQWPKVQFRHSVWVKHPAYASLCLKS